MKVPESDSGIIPRNRGAAASGNGHAPFRLAEEIVNRSVAESWHDARIEWELESVFVSKLDEPGTCLCGHYPIREHCVLRNRENDNVVVVGNCCVRRFLDMPSERVFRGLRRIVRDVEAALGPATVEFAHGRGWINDWERSFLLDTARKQRPSARVLAKRAEINAKVLACTGGPCRAY
jgi:hypothetical protein